MTQEHSRSHHRPKVGISRRWLSMLLHHLQQAVASLGEMWRTPLASVMTMAVLGVSLALPASFYVILKNAAGVSASWQESAQISLFLKKGQSEKRHQNFVQRLSLYDEIANVHYISREAAMEEFKQTSGFASALDYLDDNPLPAVVVVTPSEAHQSAAQAERLRLKLERESEVAEGKLDIQWLTRLHSMIRLLTDAILIVALLLFASVLLIVGNTIRLNILSRQTEIEVMKLVGATDAFIQRPFLYTGFWYGVIGGMLAWLLTSIMVLWMEGAVVELAALYDSHFRLHGLVFKEFLLLLGLAIGLGLIASFFSVKRHIHQIEPN